MIIIHRRLIQTFYGILHRHIHVQMEYIADGIIRQNGSVNLCCQLISLIGIKLRRKLFQKRVDLCIGIFSEVLYSVCAEIVHQVRIRIPGRKRHLRIHTQIIRTCMATVIGVLQLLKACLDSELLQCGLQSLALSAAVRYGRR